MSWNKRDEVWNSANLDVLSDVFAVLAILAVLAVAYAGIRSFRPKVGSPDSSSPRLIFLRKTVPVTAVSKN